MIFASAAICMKFSVNLKSANLQIKIAKSCMGGYASGMDALLKTHNTFCFIGCFFFLGGLNMNCLSMLD